MYVMGLKSRCTFFVVPRPEYGTELKRETPPKAAGLQTVRPLKQAEPGGGCELILG